MTTLKKFYASLKNRPPLKAGWLFLLLLLLFVPNLFITYGLMSESLLPDLHMRIVGSRWLDSHLSPYFTQWTPGQDKRFYNPNMFMPNGVNGVTVTPTMLWLELPLSRLNYCQIKFLWWLLMEGLLFFTLFFTAAISNSLKRQVAAIGIGLAFFVYSRNWYLHAYNGQYYVLFAFVFALAAFVSLKTKWQNAQLLLFPLTALLRPFFAIAVIPSLLNQKRKVWKLIVAAAILSLLIFATATPIKTWKDYQLAMKEYTSDITGHHEPATAIDYRKPGLPTEDCIFIKPQSRVFGAGALFSVQHYLNLFGLPVDNALIFLVLLALAVISFTLITKPSRINASAENLLLFSFFLYLLSELFTPAYRNPYNLVQYLGIIGVFMRKTNWQVFFCMLVGLLMNHDYPFRFAYQRELGEFIMLGSVYLSLFVNKKRQATLIR